MTLGEIKIQFKCIKFFLAQGISIHFRFTFTFLSSLLSSYSVTYDPTIPSMTQETRATVRRCIGIKAEKRTLVLDSDAD